MPKRDDPLEPLRAFDRLEVGLGWWSDKHIGVWEKPKFATLYVDISWKPYLIWEVFSNAEDDSIPFEIEGDFGDEIEWVITPSVTDVVNFPIDTNWDWMLILP